MGGWGERERERERNRDRERERKREREREREREIATTSIVNSQPHRLRPQRPAQELVVPAKGPAKGICEVEKQRQRHNWRVAHAKGKQEVVAVV